MLEIFFYLPFLPALVNYYTDLLHLLKKKGVVSVLRTLTTPHHPELLRSYDLFQFALFYSIPVTLKQDGINLNARTGTDHSPARPVAWGSQANTPANRCPPRTDR